MNKNPNTSYKHTKKYNKKIASGLKTTHTSKRLSDCIIKMTKDKETMYAKNGSDAAKLIGVSRQQVYQVLSDNPRFSSWKTAAGWTLELFPTYKATQKQMKEVVMNHLEVND